MNEFGSAANTEMVCDAISDLLEAFGGVVGSIPEASILTIANPVFPDGRTYPLVLTNRQMRLIQWGLRRAMERVERTLSAERIEAIELAHRLLDEPNADPDDDLRMMARQLIRATE